MNVEDEAWVGATRAKGVSTEHRGHSPAQLKNSVRGWPPDPPLLLVSWRVISERFRAEPGSWIRYDTLSLRVISER